MEWISDANDTVGELIQDIRALLTGFLMAIVMVRHHLLDLQTPTNFQSSIYELYDLKQDIRRFYSRNTSLHIFLEPVLIRLYEPKYLIQLAFKYGLPIQISSIIRNPFIDYVTHNGLPTQTRQVALDTPTLPATSPYKLHLIMDLDCLNLVLF